MITGSKSHSANGKTHILSVDQKLRGSPDELECLRVMLITNVAVSVHELAPYHLMFEADDGSPLLLGVGTSSLTGCCGEDAVRSYLWTHGLTVLKAQAHVKGDDRIKLFAKHHADGRLELRGISDEISHNMEWRDRQPIW